MPDGYYLIPCKGPCRKEWSQNAILTHLRRADKCKSKYSSKEFKELSRFLTLKTIRSKSMQIYRLLQMMIKIEIPFKGITYVESTRNRFTSILVLESSLLMRRVVTIRFCFDKIHINHIRSSSLQMFNFLIYRPLIWGCQPLRRLDTNSKEALQG